MNEPSSVREFAPSWLVTGVDGEPPYYVRADLAETREAIPEYLGHEWGLTPDDFKADGMEPVEDIAHVWMAPDLAAPRVDDQEPWKIVEKNDAAAVLYWRWSW